MDKSTIVCRCEEITLADIENAIALGAESFDDVKRLTRSGMGLCQAKTCHTIIQGLIADAKNRPIGTLTVSRLRMPLKLVPMAALAGAKSAQRQEK
jgi:bacterioferritin-associated ferredoxin